MKTAWFLVMLTGAILRGADLSGADLRNGRLAGADLSRARLHGCQMRLTDLSDAVLTGALGLNSEGMPA